MHSKCREPDYPKSQNKVKRFQVPYGKVEWTTDFHDYKPVNYTSTAILKSPAWADKLIGAEGFSPLWNKLDGNTDRRSHEGEYEVIDGVPQNPHGRTGIIGRGCLGKWGPNHAADPVVTRWKLDGEEKVINEKSQLPILQFVSIKRWDNGQWAIPGGMVDPGEVVTTTLQREFMEEALNSYEMTDVQKSEAEAQLKELFSKGEEIYKGYVDDPRNTDNAWMETVAFNFHDPSLKGILYSLKLQAGDDAQAVKWMDIGQELGLYASHRDFIETVAQKHKAHW
ncbi:unnamed protein product [Meganyctiphanes norvegica]|uniref:Nudix hydrolase domain-containing protein n=1 Tax=Meganyctiphanes norvegica TaxID=48144 RepID=A0AAV2RSL6_MEGNR